MRGSFTTLEAEGGGSPEAWLSSVVRPSQGIKREQERRKGKKEREMAWEGRGERKEEKGIVGGKP